MKKIVIIFILSIFWFINIINFSNWIDSSNNENILKKAFNERKEKIYQIIEWDETTQKINNLKKEISKLNINDELNRKIIENTQKQIEELEKNYKSTLESIKNIENKWNQNELSELEKLSKKLKNEIETKKVLLEKLEKQSQDNQIQQDKINILLEKYIKEKEKQNNNTSNLWKYILFFSITFILWLIYFISNWLYKKWKIDKRVNIYISFFLIFGYTIFLIWFFFYLHPELSIFLIFISGYLLAINAHLIASFIWSIIILKKFKIWDIIKMDDFRWQIIRITTINTILLPVSEEWILTNKPIIIPNVNLLKNTVVKDKNPEIIFYRYKVVLPNDTTIDIMKMLEYIEQNILIKRLNNRLSSLQWSEDSFRTSIWFDDSWKIVINFVWRADDLLNKQIERKIMWYVMSLLKEERETKELKNKTLETKEEKQDKKEEN